METLKAQIEQVKAEDSSRNQRCLDLEERALRMKNASEQMEVEHRATVRELEGEVQRLRQQLNRADQALTMSADKTVCYSNDFCNFTASSNNEMGRRQWIRSCSCTSAK